MTTDSSHDDALLSRVLISTWVLHTGRTLRRDVPASELSVEELIDFWADPMLDEPPSADRPGNEPSPSGASGNDPPPADRPAKETALEPVPRSSAGPRSAISAVPGGLAPPAPI